MQGFEDLRARRKGTPAIGGIGAQTVQFLQRQQRDGGGIAFYVWQGLLCFVHNYVALDIYHVKSQTPVPTGRHFLSMEFSPTGEPSTARKLPAMSACSSTPQRWARAI